MSEPIAVEGDETLRLAVRWGGQLSALIREVHRAFPNYDLTKRGFDAPSDIVLTIARLPVPRTPTDSAVPEPEATP